MNRDVLSARTRESVGLESLFGGSGSTHPRAFLVAVALVLAAGVWAGNWCFEQMTTPWQRGMVWAGVQARWLSLDWSQITAPNRDDTGTVTAGPEEIARYTQKVMGDLHVEMALALLGALVVAFMAAFVLRALAARAGGEKLGDQHVRGARLCRGPTDIERILRRDKKLGPFRFATVPLMRDRECQHIVLVGTPGAGKSMVIKDVQMQVREAGHKAMVFDPEGALVPPFFNSNTDVLLNPFDARMPGWNIWDELQNDYELAGFAEALFPAKSRDPFFDIAARCVFSDIVRQLRQDGRATNRDLYETATGLNVKQMHEFLCDRPGARHVDPAGERKSDSVLSTLVNKMEVWKYLPDCAAGEGFSIRNFVYDEQNNGWLFLAAPESQMPVLRDLFSLWTSVYVEAILSLPESRERRIWTFLDELPALNQIRLEPLLARGRKRGACCVLGFQALSQLSDIYGRDVSKTIRAACSTWWVGRQGDAETAEEMSKILGGAEVAEAYESVGHSTNSSHASFNRGRRRVVRPVVLGSELMDLPDLHGYVRQATLPVTPVVVPVVTPTRVADAHVPRPRPEAHRVPDIGGQRIGSAVLPC